MKIDDVILDEATMTMIASVSKKELLTQSVDLYATKYGLRKKDELHLTLVGTKTGAIIIDNPLIIQQATDFFQSRSKIELWDFHLLDEYYYMKKQYDPVDVRESVIQTIHIPRLAEFYNGLSVTIGQELSLPFAHITLATSSNNSLTKSRGIGLYSAKDFADYTVQKL